MLLGIDTSTKYFSIAVANPDGNLIYQILEHANGKHSELLFDKLKLVFQKTKIGFETITKIGVTTGPGSWTGIRVGLAFVRTVSQLCNIPVVGISTLDLLAYQMLISNQLANKFNSVKIEKFHICPMISSIQDEVYTAIYFVSKSRLIPLFQQNKIDGLFINRLTDYKSLNINYVKNFIHNELNKSRTFLRGIRHTQKGLFNIQSFPQRATEYSGKVWDKLPEYIWFVGDGAIKYQEQLRNTLKFVYFADDNSNIPAAKNLCKLASLKKGRNAKSINPIYVKPPRIHKTVLTKDL